MATNDPQPRTAYGLPMQEPGGALAPYVAQPHVFRRPIPAREPFTPNVQPPVPAKPEATGPDTVAKMQQVQAERERLLNLCRSNRAHDRCPRRCVLTGELRESGLASFDREIREERYGPWND